MKYDNAMDTYKERYHDNPNAYTDQFCREVTFQVTEACNLKCTYCYQINKSPKVMSWETAKACVDLLFNMYEEDLEDGFINRKTEFIILDFIGGEPMLQIGLIHRIVDYFIEQSLEKVPLWAETFMISISSNGTIYFSEDVQEFLRKYDGRISYSVSIDGAKEMHDKCRVFHDGSGSYDLAVAAQEHYNKTHRCPTGTKATVSPENMPYLNDTVTYFIEHHYTQIHANTIYEEDWTVEQGTEFYYKLKEVADTLLELNGAVEISLFDSNFFRPKEDPTKTWCGGYTSMLAFDTEGNCYPCIRYMESSLGTDAEPVVIGNAWEGIWKSEKAKDIYKCLSCVTWTSQNDEECNNCPIAEGCADCAAQSYQQYGCFNKRHKEGSCWVHRARSLANVYYWNTLWRNNGIGKRFHRYLPDDISLMLISQEELDMLNALEED